MHNYVKIIASLTAQVMNRNSCLMILFSDLDFSDLGIKVPR